MRVMFFDIEATDLSANWGRVLCASYGYLGEDTVWTDRRDETKRKTVTDDSSLVVAIRDTIEQADILCTWNGILYDVPMLNARLQVAGERPCKVGKDFGTHHLDLMYYATGSALRLGGKSLKRASTFFGVAHSKTELEGDVWVEAGAGNKEAMDLVVEHCEADVHVTRDLWPFLVPHVKKITLPLSAWHEFVLEIPNGRS